MYFTLAFIGAIIYLIYVYFTWKFGYWKKRGITESKPWPIIGSFPAVFSSKRNMANDMQDIYQKYKNTDNFIGVYNIRDPQLLIIDPKLSRDIYVTHFKNFHDNSFGSFFDVDPQSILSNNPFALTGEDWKTKRSEITPALTLARVKASYPVMLTTCSKLTKFLAITSKNPPKDGIDTKDICLRYTSEVVSDTVYGIEAGNFKDEGTSELHTMAQNLFQVNFLTTVYFIVAGMFPKIKKVFTMPVVPKKVENFFENVMNQAIKLRVQTKNDRPDFLNFLLDLQKKKSLTNREITSHSMTFLLDGFETSASAIAHVLLMLGRNPECQTKLRKAIADNVESDGNLTFEKLHDLAYLDMCFNETLRIFSPLLFSTKLCTESCELTNKNGTKLTVEKGDTVVLPVYGFHHDEDLFPKAEQFIPERFTEENGGTKKYKEAGSFVPFGDGPRICMGMRFATGQAKCVIVEIVKNFNITVNKKTRSDNKICSTNFVGTLDGGIYLDFEPLKKTM